MYPFMRVVDSGVDLIGGRERVYRVIECDRLELDRTCRDYPNNRPSFCEKTGVINRPAVICKFNDAINKNDMGG
jgi:hypothetical protein